MRDAIKNLGNVSTDFKKSGANFADKNAIKRLAKEGLSAETISDVLRIALACVESFMEPSPAKTPAPKPKATPEADSDTPEAGSRTRSRRRAKPQD